LEYAFVFSVHQQSSYQTNTHTHTQTDSGGREDITEKKRKTGGIKKKEKENVRQYSLSF
jgi:hypothetical protein